MFFKEIRANANSLHLNLRGAAIFFWGWRVAVWKEILWISLFFTTWRGAKKTTRQLLSMLFW